jgi:hypothetical protein
MTYSDEMRAAGNRLCKATKELQNFIYKEFPYIKGVAGLSEIAEWETVCKKEDQNFNLYSLRIHDRTTEEDPELATVMYTTNGVQGPWHDIVTGHPEWCWEVMYALTFVNAAKEKNYKD